MDLHTMCTICDNQYDEKKRRPLVLPCSHSFCQDCLQQVQAAGKKLCPVCRKTWNNVLLADLLSGYQLIPVDKPDTSLLKAMRKRKRQDSAETDVEFDVCKEHKSDLSMFCKSCELPVCRKCLLLKHKGCEMVLMEEKCDAHQEKFTEKISQFERKFSKVAPSLLENGKNMAVVRSFIVKLLSYEKEMQDYQKDLKDWQMEAEKVLAVTDDGSAAPLLCNIQNSQHNEAVVEKLALQMPNSPASPLLLAIASAYQENPENGTEFISNLNKTLTKVQDGHHTDGKAVTKTDVLKEGEVWVISDEASANAVDDLMLTTSLQPSRLKVTWTCKPEQQFALLLNSSKQLHVDFELDCFSNFEKTCQENRGLCMSLIIASARCRITHFWGQFDRDGLQRLPMTIQSVGLVLRDQQDLHLLIHFSGMVFKVNYCANERDRLVWPDWTELNLSIATTFRPENWNLNLWRHLNVQGGYENLPLSTTLSRLGIRFRLFLNQLVPGDMRWMGELLRNMALSFSDPVPLFLPGASIDPDALLGVLRDCGQCMEVHLPASLPQLVPREKVAERYNKYGHSVTWVLE